MSEVSRRDAVKLAAGLAVGTSGVLASVALGQEARKPVDRQPPKPPADRELELALKSPDAFMFAEHVTAKIDVTGPSRALVITSAAADARGTLASVPSRSMRIFRADAGVDEFTKQGGLYWRHGDHKGKTQFKKPGALVLVLRDEGGTVHWYSLMGDERC